jgi:hypothetical protein
MATSFHAQHDGEYGLSFPELPVELVNIRAVGTGRMPKVGAIASPSGAAKAPSRVAPVMFRVGDKVAPIPRCFRIAAIWRRVRIFWAPRSSPSRIHHHCPPDCTVSALESGELLIRVGLTSGDHAKAGAEMAEQPG